MPTSATPDQIRADFDRIASLVPAAAAPSGADGWILRNLPTARDRVLDLGCGTGELARRLASHFAATDAIDLSAGMIAEAMRRTPPPSRIHFAAADVFEWLAAHPETYDCIVSVAMLHHVDLEQALRACKRSLRAGGRLLIVDLCHRRHLLMNTLAFVVGRFQDAITLLRHPSSWRVWNAYKEHGRNEVYLTVDEVRACAAGVLPGAVVTESLLWRYRLRWEK